MNTLSISKNTPISKRETIAVALARSGFTLQHCFELPAGQTRGGRFRGFPLAILTSQQARAYNAPSGKRVRGRDGR